MKRSAALLFAATVLAACSRTVVVPVPPKVDLKGYGPVGIVDFGSNSEETLSARATRQFQEQVQSAQPGTRFVELGERQQLLAAVGAKQFDAPALRKIGAKYGVTALFVGDLAYSQPRTDVKVSDIAKLEGGVRTEIRGDLSARLLETASGASVWSNSAGRAGRWARCTFPPSAVSGGMSGGNPREEMVPALVNEITHDFRPTYVRQPVR